ncbi:adenylosuccinate lyase [Intestinimonas sp. MSJ-38]|uniref:adenylosuccinate lyase n=1 Tax=Intestinimonas sp. MSJ-38 TaxID=2841532 RepID=UPI001C10E7BA|nr:adenylosuccinate lyase [Intestinimonas sp. MSJ-38]MBU5432436.1 adenylosuccinate lyase [Intestinimonas sp. MSJ-38]
MKDYRSYETPLNSRYASEEMKYLFSSQYKFSTWRKLWIALAESEQELGLPITDEQLNEMRAHIDDIDFDKAAEYEKKFRHDVMAHVHTYGECCPKARGIIHLGATSCYVGDNTDVIIMREGLKILLSKLLEVLRSLSAFAEEYKGMPTLAYTHYQPAQPTTVGKRATLWANDILMDIEEVEKLMGELKLLGSKGTTGTQASFLELFDGDYSKVRQLDGLIAKKMGFESCVPVSGQTYTRKVDFKVLSVLSLIAQSAAKFSNDMRLLQHMKEMEEPFEKNQIGSSAMAYKRNPMRCERMAALARYLMIDSLNPAITAATQWFERTLDDSANKRLSIAEAFLCCDAVLNLYENVSAGLVVYPKMIEKHLREELPFMATENIMMDAVRRGGDRQELHEHIREHSMDAARQVKLEGKSNDLLHRIAQDPIFGVTEQELEGILQPEKYIGCAAMQTEDFLRECVQPVLDRHADIHAGKAEINV